MGMLPELCRWWDIVRQSKIHPRPYARAGRSLSAHYPKYSPAEKSMMRFVSHQLALAV
jgi:hypothetical protein